jgi:hypothetical protein
VPDRKPPRLAGGEREVLLGLLQFQRESLLRKLGGVDEGAARRSAVGSGTTLLWLVKHLAQAELRWVAVRFAGLDVSLPDDTVAESDTVASVVAGYQAASAQADAIIAAASLDDPCSAGPGAEPLPLRWVVAHLLEETARHAGHADILRELIDGSTGR